MLNRRSFVKLGLGVAVVGLAGAYAFWLVGCFPKHELVGFGTDTSDAVIGIVRESQDFSPSRVYYLSSNLEVVGSVPINHSMVGSSWQDTCIAGNKLVLPVDTSKTVPERTKVLSLDVTTQELTTWLADRPWCVAANDTQVFTGTNSLSATFTAYTRNSAKTATFEVPNESNEALLWYDGSLWAVNITMPWTEDALSLYQLAEDMSLVSETKLALPADADESVASLSVKNIAAFDGCLYISTAAESELGTGIPWGRVCRYDIATGEYTWLKLAEDYTQTVRFALDKMVVLHSDPFYGVPRVCTYDKDGQLLAKSEALSNRPLQMVVVDGVVYVADAHEVWALDLDTLEVINTVEVDAEGECANNTGLFMMP